MGITHPVSCGQIAQIKCKFREIRNRCMCSVWGLENDCRSQNRAFLVDIDYCQSDPCMNGATCLTTTGRYFCACPAGFTGFRCEVGESVMLCNYCWSENSMVHLLTILYFHLM